MRVFLISFCNKTMLHSKKITVILHFQVRINLGFSSHFGWHKALKKITLLLRISNIAIKIQISGQHQKANKNFNCLYVFPYYTSSLDKCYFVRWFKRANGKKRAFKMWGKVFQNSEYLVLIFLQTRFWLPVWKTKQNNKNCARKAIFIYNFCHLLLKFFKKEIIII